MNTLESLFYFFLGLSLMVVPLVAAAAWMFMLWRRSRESALASTGVPLGSSTSRTVETIAIAAGCILLIAFATTQLDWRELVFADTANISTLRPWGVAVVALALAGLVTALAFAWRGAGSVATVVLILVTFGYAAAIAVADRVDRSSQPGNPPSSDRFYPDLNLVFDVGGCNIAGAELRINGVALGKTPVRIKLSEFLHKVPNWKEPPGPTWQNDSLSDDPSQTFPPRLKDNHWLTWRLLDFPFVRLPEKMVNARINCNRISEPGFPQGFDSRVVFEVVR